MSEAVDHPRLIAGRYQILRVLGQGGMGAVYQAYDTRLERIVALKTIRPEYLAHQQASQRFFREARALARLNHPNILTLFDYGQDDDLHYLVMELGGPDLQHLLEQHGGPPALERSLHLALSVSRALEYAHSHGIVHRDLKPANILVGGPGASDVLESVRLPVVKVMDFGLAKV